MKRISQLPYSRLPDSDEEEQEGLLMNVKRPRRLLKWILAGICAIIVVSVLYFLDNFACNLIPMNVVEEYPRRVEIPITTATEIAVLEGNNCAIFRKRPEVAHVDCARLFRDDKEYMKEIAKNRPFLQQQSVTFSTCESIRNRFLPARNPDTGFPILHVRIVYKDYEFLEDQLMTNYASENVYCFAIDRKAPHFFHENFLYLEKCLPNVVIAKEELEFDSGGHNQNEAHLNCMRAVRDKKWEYAILMQNHDVIIKTHSELTEILKIYGGANDVDLWPCPEHRCISSLEKNLGRLELCPKRMSGVELEKCETSDIQWGKGAMQAMLSRAAVDFIFNEINIYPLMKQMNDMDYGVDEQLYGSLEVTPEIRFPGGFNSKCLDKDSQSITRLTNTRLNVYGLSKCLRKAWNWITGSTDNDCPSGMQRHASCIYGVEDLPTLAISKKIMANKVWPDFDVAVTSCISELLFNRTKDGPNIDREFYKKINLVRYHHEHNNPGFEIDQFQCEL